MNETEGQNVASNMMFAFSHGIRLALETQGKTIDDPEAVAPILRRMIRISQGDPKASLVAYHDDFPGELSAHMREVETELCKEYLAEVDKSRQT